MLSDYPECLIVERVFIPVDPRLTEFFGTYKDEPNQKEQIISKTVPYSY